MGYTREFRSGLVTIANGCRNASILQLGVIVPSKNPYLQYLGEKMPDILSARSISIHHEELAHCPLQDRCRRYRVPRDDQDANSDIDRLNCQHT